MRNLNIQRKKGVAIIEVVLAIVITIITICFISIVGASYLKADKLSSESSPIFEAHFENAKSKISTSQDPYVTKALVDVLHDCTSYSQIMVGILMANRDKSPKDFVENEEKGCSSALINKVALSQGGKYASVIAREIQRLGYPVEKITSDHIAETASLSDINLASITAKTNQQSL